MEASVPPEPFPNGIDDLLALSSNVNSPQNGLAVDMELPKTQRLTMAYEEWKASNGVLSIKGLARKYGVASTTLLGRSRGATSIQSVNMARQKLSVDEEGKLRDYILLLSSWGWVIQIEQIRSMAREILRARGDEDDLGAQWHHSFLSRQSELRDKIVRKNMVHRSDQYPVIVRDWFELFRSTTMKYKIHRDDIYNVDVRFMTLSNPGTAPVMLSRHEMHAMAGSTLQEWASLTECIASTGRLLPPWINFHNASHVQEWYNALRGTDGHATFSATGQSDTVLGLGLLRDHFVHFSSKIHGDSGNRLLIIDGYGSRISTQVIQFCLDHKIIALCFPPHITQILPPYVLQPLDTGVWFPLAAAYKDCLREHFRIHRSHSVDTLQFLEICLVVRGVATIKNVQDAWKRSGLDPWNPEIVLSQLPIVESQLSQPLGTTTPGTPSSLSEMREVP